MTIGFFHVDTKTEASEQGYLCARAMVKSAQTVMPYVDIVQFTDLTSPAVKGVDAVRRKPSEPMGLLRMRHHAGVAGEWLFVDTDVLFRQPVTSVFRSEFDIALTTRHWLHLKPAAGFTERMPFNTGVVFSRCPHFWSEVYTRMRALDPAEQAWMGDQQVICEVAAEPRYLVKKLKGAIYNFPPEVPGAQPTSAELEAVASIVHFKGPERKAMMLEQAKGKRRCA